MKVRYTPRARDDLEDILKYISERSPRGARNVQRSIKKTIDLIGRFPLAGRIAGIQGASARSPGKPVSVPDLLDS